MVGSKIGGVGTLDDAGFSELLLIHIPPRKEGCPAVIYSRCFQITYVQKRIPCSIFLSSSADSYALRVCLSFYSHLIIQKLFLLAATHGRYDPVLVGLVGLHTILHSLTPVSSTYAIISVTPGFLRRHSNPNTSSLRTIV